MAREPEKSKMSPEPAIQVTQPDYDFDYEKHGAQREANPLPELKRKLKSRHLQMIAIGEWHDLTSPRTCN